MKTITYIWTWKDDENVYVNQDESLEAIIENIIEYYNGDEIEDLTVELNNGLIDVSYFDIVEDEETEWEIKATPFDVAEFLNDFSESHNRNDWFDIEVLETESKETI